MGRLSSPQPTVSARTWVSRGQSSEPDFDQLPRDIQYERLSIDFVVAKVRSHGRVSKPCPWVLASREASPASSRSLPRCPDEDFWFRVRESFTIHRNSINLNSGSVSPAPGPVQTAMHQ